jgi:uncharacterized protein (TIGR02466 family)
MTAEVHQLFPRPLYKNNINYSFSEQELTYINSIKNTFYQENGTVQDGNNYVLDKHFSIELKTLLQNQLNVYAKEVFCYDCDVYITHSWINVNPPKSCHYSHNHVNSIFSGVFYIQVPEDSPGLKIWNDRTSMFYITPNKFNSFNSHGMLINVKQGDIVLFPSEMQHEVSQNNSSIDRISLAFNSFVRGSIGDLDRSNFIEIK